MKKLIALALCSVIFIGCKNVENDVAPDSIENTVTDTISIDTIANANNQLENNYDDDSAIEVSAADGKIVEVQYATFGDKISADKALSQEQMMKKYATLKKGDTVTVKFKSTIKEVCKKKGCWMKMDLAGKESFVRFKDYGFFVPLNADNSEAIVSGRAYLDVVSVDDLKHYAKDGGKSDEEIEKIKEAKVTYAFQADGVLIQK